ncbi:phosphoketolase family protein [Salinifilum ghardaiensis]
MRTLTPAKLDADEHVRLDALWRATNYLAVGQLYLHSNPLLTEPLRSEHIKPRLLGHWGTVPGLTLVYTHLNRLIRHRDLDVIYVTGPGHGGAGLQAASWLEGTFTETYPEVTRDAAGMARLCKQFSFPGGMPSHVGPEVPGSINEGGELGYSLAHAYGAVFDNPDLIAACVVADGEAETGPLAAAWHGNKFLDPVHDGAVLPVLHLNSYKIANPTVLSGISDAELTHLLEGCGHVPYLVDGDDPEHVHAALASTLDRAVDEIHRIQAEARERGKNTRPPWPVIVLRTPKGWTGPHEFDGKLVEGTWRSHQLPLPDPAGDADQRERLQSWLLDYRPGELFDEDGEPRSAVTEAVPRPERRMSASPHTNGGARTELDPPRSRPYMLERDRSGREPQSPTQVLGRYLRDLLQASHRSRDFRVFSPDELDSNKLSAVYEATDRAWNAAQAPVDAHLSQHGRVMEVLSEHTLQGWLEGYLLTGRHGLFASYEAFIHIVDSMVNQFAKWLKVSGELSWRPPVPALTYLLTSHVWQQDHNGFSHQDPGFLDHVTHKKPDVVRVYLPPDANTLLWTVEHCLRSRDLINVIVTGKQPQPTWLDPAAAAEHCARGAGVWEWACTGGDAPDVVLACAGDVPTRETLAAVDVLSNSAPHLSVRVVNVVDLMRLQPAEAHPHGLTDRDFDALFTTDRPIVFAYHGYPWLIHRLTHGRTNRDLHVRGYREEGTTTTPFDMAVRNRIDRFDLVLDVLHHAGRHDRACADLRQAMHDERAEHDRHTREHGTDLPEVRAWHWPVP